MPYPRTCLAAVTMLAALASVAAPSGPAGSPPVRSVAVRGPAPAQITATPPVAPKAGRPAPHRVAPAPPHPAWRAGQYRYRTAEAAMRALARAYNRHDVRWLRSMANPSAVDGLERMRVEATGLRLVSCGTEEGFGFLCSFSHGYPAALHRGGRGRASMQPAYDAKHGWYLAGSVECG